VLIYSKRSCQSSTPPRTCSEVYAYEVDDKGCPERRVQAAYSDCSFVETSDPLQIFGLLLFELNVLKQRLITERRFHLKPQSDRI
jgi:hypothetical protein